MPTARASPRQGDVKRRDWDLYAVMTGGTRPGVAQGALIRFEKKRTRAFRLAAKLVRDGVAERITVWKRLRTSYRGLQAWIRVGSF